MLSHFRKPKVIYQEFSSINNISFRLPAMHLVY